MSNQADDLDPTEWDVIFRVGPQRDSSLIARKIGEVKDIWLPASILVESSATNSC